MAPVRVLVADDEPVIRAALEELIDGHPELELAGSAVDAQQAIDLAAQVRPDVVLLDVRMPHGGGPRAAAEIDALPDAPRTVAFSAYDDRSAILSMLQAGARGYLVKGATNADIAGTLISAGRLGVRRPPVVIPTADRRLRVLIADAATPARESLEDALGAHQDFHLVGVAANAGEALRLSCITHPHAVLVGRELPGGSTLAISEIRAAVPEARVLAYTRESEPRGVREAVEAGAMSYLVTSEPAEQVVAALRAAGRGHSVLSPAAATAVVHELSLPPGVNREHRRRDQLRSTLERYILGDGLSVALQPIFDLESGEPIAMEALARFSGGETEGPSLWFARAAEEGLGHELERAAFQTALGTLAGLPAGINLSVNVSPAFAASPDFGHHLGEVPAERVIVELTEHDAVEDYDGLASSFRDLRDRGLQLAVDDAGAGFASLRHVLLIEPDYLKLDISLCAGIAHDRRRRALARALLAFAREIEIHTVAEGVESAEDLCVLRELGVELGQGFHLAPPAGAEAIAGD